MLQRIFDRLPTLERDQRKALLERVEEGARSDSDYHVMMLLSSGLAFTPCGWTKQRATDGGATAG